MVEECSLGEGSVSVVEWTLPPLVDDLLERDVVPAAQQVHQPYVPFEKVLCHNSVVLLFHGAKIANVTVKMWQSAIYCIIL